MTHRALVVFNPQAGRGRGHKRAAEVQHALQAASIHCESVVSVGNNRRNGGGLLVNPDAVPDDGLLDLCIVDATPRKEILRLLPKAMKGSHRGEPAVELTRSTRLVVESVEPLPVHAGGEILWNDVHRVEITVEPGRLEVVG